ncbi:MAG: hypothetical protein WAU86_23090 [Oricola sp.]
MIGQIAFALWIATVTLAGIYFGQSLSATPADQGASAEAGGSSGGHGGGSTAEFQTDLFAVPYVDKNGLQGYLTGRFTLKTVPAGVAALKIPLSTLIFDALTSHFYSEAGPLSTSTGWSRLRESLDELRDLVNETAGHEVVAEVLIQQLDYFARDDIRMGDEKSFAPAVKTDEVIKK